MKLPLGCIHFNSDLLGQGGTPSWGQELGQSVGYLMTREGCTDILHGMIQNQIMDHNNFVFGRTRSVNSHVTKLLAIFKEVVVQIYSVENDSSTEHRMDSNLILILQQESGNRHEGRKTIKFNRGFEYLENKNEDFYDEIISNVDSGSPIFSYSIDYNTYRNELKLTFIAAPSGESPYENSQLRGDIWNDYIKKYEIKTGQSVVNETLSGKNLIYFGPPGTGKSHRANELIGSALCTKTQFHPEYSYGDFVGSYRPVVGSHLTDKAKDPQEVEIPLPINYFSFVPGPLMVALVDALKKYLHDKSSPEPHYLLVDEINRGDCSSIFGDIFQLLDRNSEGFSEYGIDPRPEIKIWLDNEFKEIGEWAIKEENKLSLPPNFIILGTMNTSDQNLYPMDTAFKRRWEWESCSVEEEYEILLKKYANNTPVLEFKEKKYEWIKLLRKLNRLITSGQQGMEDKQIGPWFIKPALDDGTICSESFANKLLFYLWCDVFKDELDSESSPFINYHEEQNEINTFGMLQSLFKVKGLEAIFKPEILKDCLVQSSNVGASGEEPKILAESPSIDESEQVAKH